MPDSFVMPLTVEKLIELLARLDQKSQVYLAYNDCYSSACSVHTIGKGEIAIAEAYQDMSVDEEPGELGEDEDPIRWENEYESNYER